MLTFACSGLRRFGALASALVLCSLPHQSPAHTAIALAQTDVRRSIFAAHNYDNQALADRAAVQGCQEALRKNGLANLLGQCQVVERQTRTGAGALVCGDTGCASGYGDSEALARQAALVACRKPDNDASCDMRISLSWIDLAVTTLPTRPAATPANRTLMGQPSAGQSASLPGTPTPPSAWQSHVLRLMNRHYGAFDKRLQCWVATVVDRGDKQRWCMRVFSQHWGAALPDGAPSRLLLLATGHAIDEAGEEVNARVVPGLVGAFVAQGRGGELDVVSSSPKLPLGGLGLPPGGWQLQAFGQDLWGWRAGSGDCHMGYCATRVHLLVPQGRSVNDRGFADGLEDSGNCTDAACEARASDLKIGLTVDEAAPVAAIYPLVLTLSGKFEGRAIQPKIVRASMDSRSGRYALPKDAVFMTVLGTP